VTSSDDCEAVGGFVCVMYKECEPTKPQGCFNEAIYVVQRDLIGLEVRALIAGTVQLNPDH
jgi:hypothetical protein